MLAETGLNDFPCRVTFGAFSSGNLIVQAGAGWGAGGMYGTQFHLIPSLLSGEHYSHHYFS
ncbi:hypothetical protein [Gluconacetobacter tumulisoli]|uniref:Uncharacterized protein n=1 Tax=Gluconacetobacter tumulisoli TaxID=1286189 RepID=A0A7W4PLF2_9PROT|nr:hypothetical protein [Gluconacetobacter tumulisoli]MBB2200589.1 hypothetical protein [Gluconacetobacter tumulisoli]